MKKWGRRLAGAPLSSGGGQGNGQPHFAQKKQQACVQRRASPTRKWGTTRSQINDLPHTDETKPPQQRRSATAVSVRTEDARLIR